MNEESTHQGKKQEMDSSKGMGETGHPASQLPLSTELVTQLGDSATDYAHALWTVAQDRDADADEMTASIIEVNDRFGVYYPETIVAKWQEIFRNVGGFVTIICEERVLAGAMSDANAYESPHAANAPDESTDTAG